MVHVPRATYDEIRRKLKASAVRKAKRKEKSVLLWGRKAGVTTRALDDLWAFVVKLRDRAVNRGLCRICGRRPIAVAYHILQRGYWAIRWHLDNGVGACAECNWWEVKTRQQAPSQVDARHEAIFGKEYLDRLRALKNGPKQDHHAVREYLKTAIEEKPWKK